MSAGEYEMKKAGINEGIFMAKIEKLIKKLKKTENKTSKDMMEALLDIKDEIELSFNIKFNMDDIWETFNKKMSEGNVNLPKETIESFQHDFKKRNKKRKHHAIHIEEMIESDTYRFDECGKCVDYEAKKENQQVIDSNIPWQLAFSISMGLGGCFLCCIPWGVTQAIGGGMITTCIGGCIAYMYEEEEKQRTGRAIV